MAKLGHLGILGPKAAKSAPKAAKVAKVFPCEMLAALGPSWQPWAVFDRRLPRLPKLAALAKGERSIVTRTITAHEATVKTATVEVKALTISGRQVTLSVFRQLQNEPLLDPVSGELLGLPWGTVNYYFGGCTDDHLHVVWQKGDELRRSCVYSRRYSGDRTDANELDELTQDWQRTAWLVAASDVLTAWQETGRLPPGEPNLTKLRVTGAREDWGEIGPRDKYGDPLFSILKTDWDTAHSDDHVIDNTLACGDPRITYGCRPDSLYGCHHNRHLTPEERQGRLHQTQTARMLNLEEKCRELMNGDSTPTRADLSAAIRAYWEMRRGREARNATWARHYAEIQALDQLFIAV